MARKTIEYLIEYKPLGLHYFNKSVNGFKDKDFALKLVQNGENKVTVRVVKQTREVVKVFERKADDS